MRPLSEIEVKAVLSKLKEYLGSNLRQLIERDDEPHVFRLHKQNVFYVSESVLKKTGCVARDKLVACGVCFGKFTHSGKFHLKITCLDFLARLCKYKIWLKPNGEQHFLYNNHVVKAHLRRITEDVPRNAGVVIFSEIHDIPLGFGKAARTTAECREVPPEAIVAYHHSDIGEYLREEANLI